MATRKPREPNEAPSAPAGSESPTEPTGRTEDDLDEHVRRALAHWPQIDPEVEGIVTRIDKVDRYIHRAATTSLGQVGLTHQEFKVLIALHAEPLSHGALCRHLLVSTGAMTNRLDKLERSGLLTRMRDPNDRRGVLLELTARGRGKLDEYVDLEAKREVQLLTVLDPSEQHQLNHLLRKLMRSLQSELGSPPPG
jgi:DNA-binding MarR family transcriptional regulator